MLLLPQRRKLEDKVEPRSYSVTMLAIQPRNELNSIVILCQIKLLVYVFCFSFMLNVDKDQILPLYRRLLKGDKGIG